jgi:hypothetical protein
VASTVVGWPDKIASLDAVGTSIGVVEVHGASKVAILME